MSVSLVKVKGPDSDGDGSDDVQVTLPLVLGRGALLKCGDKKVSRRHAYLDWEDEGVLITAVHQSPTYVVVGEGQVQEVAEGSSLLLSHGDKFGLLRDKFWYIVKISSSVLEVEKKSVTPLREGERSDNEDICKEKENGEEEEGTKESTENLKLNGEAKRREEERDREEIKEVGEEGGKDERLEDIESNATGETKEEMERMNTEETTNGIKDNIDAKEHDEMDENEEEDGGVIETRNDSPSTSSSVLPSNTPHSTSSPKTEIKENLSSVVNKRNRSLPSWFKDSKDENPTLTTTPESSPRANKRQARAKASPNGKKAKTTATLANTTTTTTTNTTNTTTTTSTSAETDEKLFTLERVSKRRQQSPQKQQKTTESLPSPSAATEGDGDGSGHHQVSDSDDDAAAGNTTTTTTALSPSPYSAKRSKEDAEEDREEEASTTTTTGPMRAFPTPSPATGNTPRPSCQYGAGCYRKNPVHREEEAHPGDTDYRSPAAAAAADSDDDDDDRPQCEYGVDCYRKNPQHRRDFKHSRIPQPQRRAKRKARQQKGRKGSDEDDYDFDDPFLNDGSSDDYAPTDDSSDSAMDLSQGVEEEDTGRMMKEAKKFVKKRK